MDMVGIDIHFVSIKPCKNCYWQTAFYNITNPKPALGKALDIELPHGYQEGEEVDIQIFYTTNNYSTAISWMTTEQTACKTMPYLYS